MAISVDPSKVYSREEYDAIIQEILKLQEETKKQQAELASQLEELKNANVMDTADDVIANGGINPDTQYAQFLRDIAKKREASNTLSAPINAERPNLAEEFEPSVHSWLYERYAEKEAQLLKVESQLAELELVYDNFVKSSESFWTKINNVNVTKSVGPGGDFNTLQGAFNWIKNAMFGPTAVITLQIRNGYTHSGTASLNTAGVNIVLTGGGPNTTLQKQPGKTGVTQNWLSLVDGAKIVVYNLQCSKIGTVYMEEGLMCWYNVKILGNVDDRLVYAVKSRFWSQNLTINGNISGDNTFHAWSSSNFSCHNTAINGNISGNYTFHAWSSSNFSCHNTAINGNISGNYTFYAGDSSNFSCHNTAINGNISGNSTFLAAGSSNFSCHNTAINGNISGNYTFRAAALGKMRISNPIIKQATAQFVFQIFDTGYIKGYLNAWSVGYGIAQKLRIHSSQYGLGIWYCPYNWDWSEWVTLVNSPTEKSVKFKDVGKMGYTISGGRPTYINAHVSNTNNY